MLGILTKRKCLVFFLDLQRYLTPPLSPTRVLVHEHFQDFDHVSSAWEINSQNFHRKER